MQINNLIYYSKLKYYSTLILKIKIIYFNSKLQEYVKM